MNSLDPTWDCTLQAELIVTTSSGGDTDSFAMGECGGRGIPSFIMPLAWSVVQCFDKCGQGGPLKLFETFVFSPLSTHCLTPHFHMM